MYPNHSPCHRRPNISDLKAVVCMSVSQEQYVRASFALEREHCDREYGGAGVDCGLQSVEPTQHENLHFCIGSAVIVWDFFFFALGGGMKEISHFTSSPANLSSVPMDKIICKLTIKTKLL